MTLDTLLKEATFWKLGRRGILAIIETEDGARQDAYEVSDDDLRKHHPLFPDALAATIRGAAKGFMVYNDGQTELRGRYAMDVLKVLHGDLLEYNDVNGVDRKALKVVSLSIDYKEQVVNLGAIYTETMSVIINGVTVPYVWDTMRDNVKVSAHELQDRFPGWFERMALGLELDIQQDALFQYIFSQTIPEGVKSGIDLPAFG